MKEMSRSSSNESILNCLQRKIIPICRKITTPITWTVFVVDCWIFFSFYSFRCSVVARFLDSLNLKQFDIRVVPDRRVNVSEKKIYIQKWWFIKIFILFLISELTHLNNSRLRGIVERGEHVTNKWQTQRTLEQWILNSFSEFLIDYLRSSAKRTHWQFFRSHTITEVRGDWQESELSPL